jgi:hypothetical protein
LSSERPDTTLQTGEKWMIALAAATTTRACQLLIGWVTRRLEERRTKVMAKKIPLFPMTANVWRNASAIPGPPDLVVQCQLHVPTAGRAAYGSTPTLIAGTLFRSIYVPKGTDLRPIWPSSLPDVIECPAGTGRFYHVWDLDDVAKGFPNEFRCASVIVYFGIAGSWPTPIP